MSFQINVNNIDTVAIKNKASEMYRAGGLGCGECVVKTLIEELHIDVPIEAVCIASGFSAGIGGAGCTCGAVAGGVIVLGLVFGRHEAGDPRGPVTKELAKQLHDAFKADHRAICCRILTKDFEHGSAERKENCINLVGDVTEKVCEIIKREFSI